MHHSLISLYARVKDRYSFCSLVIPDGVLNQPELQKEVSKLVSCENYRLESRQTKAHTLALKG